MIPMSLFAPFSPVIYWRRRTHCAAVTSSGRVAANNVGATKFEMDRFMGAMTGPGPCNTSPSIRRTL